MVDQEGGPRVKEVFLVLVAGSAESPDAWQVERKWSDGRRERHPRVFETETLSRDLVKARLVESGDWYPV